ncbi:BLUF domain-containing protein [Methylobacterium frigidaeris]|uniref:BLUF domain-containing protein n=1 Tax=Methylobacterium frigidaeris TaxID=2038277 RepID=A0AA37HGY6_9HYPH|nr:BLUF domain-containing protein [Methylobacterium frigidaeris]PIK71892.1 blue light sensor protein [Methylobacterium frigidaeris]GJD65563.1 hypothetical protein MPEAHAMD_5758 [Methylobacterium frigidaeris]
MPLHRLLYTSEMALVGSETEVRQQVADIVARSAARNAADGLTGALLQTRGMFIQALEGPLAAVEATFERICCDLRHRRVDLQEFVRADSRVFGEWSMVSITPDRTIEKLFTAADLLNDQEHEAVSAQATIQLMRSLLLTDSVP